MRQRSILIGLAGVFVYSVLSQVAYADQNANLRLTDWQSSDQIELRRQFELWQDGVVVGAQPNRKETAAQLITKCWAIAYDDREKERKFDLPPELAELLLSALATQAPDPTAVSLPIYESMMIGRDYHAVEKRVLPGTHMSRANLAHWLMRRARESAKAQTLTRVRDARASLNYALCDQFSQGALFMLLNLKRQPIQEVHVLLGITAEQAAEFLRPLQNMQDASQRAGKTIAPLARASDDLIRSANAKEYQRTKLDKFVLNLRAGLLDESKVLLLDLGFMQIQELYRVRSTLENHQLQDDRAVLAKAVDEIKKELDNKLIHRWLDQAMSVPAKEFQGSGINVVTDPNHPSLKGQPPQ